MACGGRGKPCLRKINFLAGRLNLSVQMSVKIDDVIYEAVIKTEEGVTHKFKTRYDALVFLVRIAKSAGVRY